MAKRKIIWSKRAKLDIYEILDFYNKRNGSKNYSNKLYKSFKESIKHLEKHPEIGVNTDFENIRNLIDGNFSVFYKIETNIIEIISIWDNRQDWENINLK